MQSCDPASIRPQRDLGVSILGLEISRSLLVLKEALDLSKLILISPTPQVGQRFEQARFSFSGICTIAQIKCDALSKCKGIQCRLKTWRKGHFSYGETCLV